MTRYLPIRKEEFDLRSHIESSGHSVDTCYHVILTEKMCKGYLVKMGGKIKSWKKRWFVFDRLKRTLSYYVGEKKLSLLCFFVFFVVCHLLISFIHLFLLHLSSQGDPLTGLMELADDSAWKIIFTSFK